MDDAVEDLNRMAREQASEEEMRALAEQVRQLREMIRRQRREQGGEGDDGEGGSGSGRGSRGGPQSRMDRYVLRARGGDDGEGQGMRVGVRSGGGESGDGEAQGEQGAQQGGEDSQGTPGGASGSSPGEEGEGGEGGEGDEPMLVLGGEQGGDTTLLLPGMGSGPGDHEGGSDEGEGDQGSGAGHERGGASLADPTDRSGDHRTVAVRGDDRGRGPSRSEVIRGGAARGFASRDYERVYAEYERHATESIERDEVPPGYRFYVRRYFDLIRPREDDDPVR
jgi:hypothetical protein